MIDVVNFKGEKFELGFEKVLHTSELNIKYGDNEEKNRKILEDRRLDILVVSNFFGKDNLHFRNSGLNQVSCKLARENEIAIGFSFNDVLNSDNKSLLIGRLKQNTKLCRKFKVKIVLASFAKNKYEMRHAKDLIAFGRVIGMNGEEVKKAMNFTRKEKKVVVC